MSGHTPGPWSINDMRTVEGDFMVCAGEGHGYGLIAQVTLGHDAKLITAAPDMFDALNALLGTDPIHNGALYSDRIKLALAAVVKATGAAPANRDEPTRDTTAIVPNQSYAALVAERDALRKALGVFLGHDDRFYIGVAGNPIAVDRMMDEAREVYALSPDASQREA